MRPERCARCGRPLRGDDAQPARHQVTEIPLARADVVEHRRHTLCCERCGAKTATTWGEEVPEGRFGARLMLRRRTGKRARLVLDDTTLPKQGKSSVGVARQYCGALGKVANCQSVVTWHYADAQIHFPLLGRLYLPQVWTTDVERMERGGVPAECQVFREKWKMALELLDELASEVEAEAVICDAGYGEVKEFLRELDRQGQVFVAQICVSHHLGWLMSNCSLSRSTS